jgi:hypothetical protein
LRFFFRLRNEYEPTVSEARRVGTFDKLSVKAPRRSLSRRLAGLFFARAIFLGFAEHFKKS